MTEQVRITVNLNQEEADRLIEMAKAQFRHPRQQARLLLVNALKVARRQASDDESAGSEASDSG